MDPTPFIEQLLTIPIPTALCSEFERPTKEETIARRVFRFNQGVVESRHGHQTDPETTYPGRRVSRRVQHTRGYAVAPAPAHKAVITKMTVLSTNSF